MKFETRTVTTVHPKHGKIEFETRCAVSETPDEFFTRAGGQDKGMEFINGAEATGAVNGARAYARNAAETETVEQIVAKARAISEAYTPSGGSRSPGVKAKASTLDSLMARVAKGETISQDELQELAAKFGAAAPAA